MLINNHHSTISNSQIEKLIALLDKTEYTRDVQSLNVFESEEQIKVHISEAAMSSRLRESLRTTFAGFTYLEPGLTVIYIFTPPTVRF